MQIAISQLTSENEYIPQGKVLQEEFEDIHSKEVITIFGDHGVMSVNLPALIQN